MKNTIKPLFGFILGIVLSILFFIGFISTIPKVEKIDMVYFLISPEHPSPKERINMSYITIMGKNRYLLDFSKLNRTITYLRAESNTNSMDPIFDSGVKLFVFKPKNKDDIKIGDIIGYINPKNRDYTSMHRVVNIKDGFFFMKGDNWEDESTPDKVNFSDIKYVYLGDLW